MTTPPFDPVGPAPEPSDDRTEPVPSLQPADRPVFQPAAAEPAPGPAPVPAEPVRRGSSGSSRVINLALGLAVVVAAAGIAFAAGRATAPATSASTAFVRGNGSGSGPNASFDVNGNGFPSASGGPDRLPGNGAGGRGGLGGLGGGLVIEGTVDSVAADSVTIKTAEGTTITVGLDSSTTYHSATEAAASDVTAGASVKLQIAGGFPRGGNGGGTGTSDAVTLGTAGDITIVP